MKRRKKMAALLLSAAVLSGAWLMAEYREREPAAEAAAADDPTPEGIDLSVGRARDLTALSWSWDGQTVNLARDAATGRWINADDETCPIDAGAAERLARAAAGVEASMAIQGETDLARYGLDAPALTVMAAAEDVIAEYEVGNMSITGAYYLRRRGDDAVYMEEGALTAFRIGVEDILALESLPADAAVLTGLTVSSGAEDYEVRYIQTPEPGWYRTDGPQTAALDGALAEALCRTLLETDLSRCVTWNGDMADYGLDEPQLRAELSYENAGGQAGAVALEFGRYEGDDVYVRLAGSAMVYLTAASVPDALLYPDWAAMEPAAVLALTLEDVAELQVAADGGRWEVLRLEETVERAVGAGDETVETTDVIYSCNGRVLDGPAVEAWLRSLADLTAEDRSPAGEGRQTLLTATLLWKDEESPAVELELRSYDSVHALCVVGGDRYLLVSRAAAEAVAASAAEVFS